MLDTPPPKNLKNPECVDHAPAACGIPSFLWHACCCCCCGTMAKSRAGRRDARHAKRQVAKLTRTTKYEHQKGRGIKKRGAVQRMPSHNLCEDAEERVAVVRDGQAVWTTTDGSECAGHRSDDRDEASAGQHLTAAQKKLRALNKKMRRVSELKQRRKRGVELDSQQQAMLRMESQLQKDIDLFEASVQQLICSPSDGNDSDGNISESDQPARQNRLMQRRHTKHQKRLAKLGGTNRL